VLQIELRRLAARGILLARAARGVLGNAGLDRRNVARAEPGALQIRADFQRGVDRGVDHAAARIALGPEAALGEIEFLPEIGECLRLPGEPARKGAAKTAARLD